MSIKGLSIDRRDPSADGRGSRRNGRRAEPCHALRAEAVGFIQVQVEGRVGGVRAASGERHFVSSEASAAWRMMVVPVSRNKDSRRMCFAHRHAALCFRARTAIGFFDIVNLSPSAHAARQLTAHGGWTTLANDEWLVEPKQNRAVRDVAVVFPAHPREEAR
jgi:hypothetical protein